MTPSRLLPDWARASAQVVLQPRQRGSDAAAALGYAMVIIDEAHHVYSRPAARSAVEALVTSGTRRMLLSDVSQSHGRGIDYPPGLQELRRTRLAAWCALQGPHVAHRHLVSTIAKLGVSGRSCFRQPRQ